MAAGLPALRYALTPISTDEPDWQQARTLSATVHTDPVGAAETFFLRTLPGVVTVLVHAVRDGEPGFSAYPVADLIRDAHGVFGRDAHGELRQGVVPDAGLQRRRSALMVFQEGYLVRIVDHLRRSAVERGAGVGDGWGGVGVRARYPAAR